MPEGAAGEAFQDFVGQVKAFKPEAFERQPLSYLSLWYDAVYVLKAAVEGTGGKTDGPSVAAWLETNSGSFNGINSGLTASKATHFLVGPGRADDRLSGPPARRRVARARRLLTARGERRR